MEHMDNLSWTTCLIDQLIHQGITYFCLSPGSRSTPLALAIANHPKAEVMIHFDERGMAFHALGYAKAAGKPAVIVTTSGTATANLFPAIMEAKFSHTPLILLTADRPPELRDVGANQTVDQIKLFEGHVLWNFDLPCPEQPLPSRFLATTIAHAVHCSKQGPVHLNCPFREPLYRNNLKNREFGKEAPQNFDAERATIAEGQGASEHQNSEAKPTKPKPDSSGCFGIFTSSEMDAEFSPVEPTIYEQIENTLSSSTVEKWAKLLSSYERGIVILGNQPSPLSFAPLMELLDRLKWPVFSDILSSFRSQGEVPFHMPTCDIDATETPDIVLHLGDRIVTSPPLASVYCLVADHPDRHDPKHQVTHRITCNPLHFCALVAPKVRSRPPTDWYTAWIEKKERLSHAVAQFFEKKSSFAELSIVHALSKIFPETWALFLANSLPIRAANRVFFPPHRTGPVFANRGVSGIDGNIATAIGIAQGTQRPTLAILGDLSTLHDLNSLAQLKKASYPVTLLIFNNGGGGIFSFLPIKEKNPHFEQFWTTPHSWTFGHAAKLFDLPYIAPSSLEELTSSLFKSSCLIEVTTSREENVLIHKEFQHALSHMDICRELSRH